MGRRFDSDVRCVSCNDEWLNGRLICRECRQPLRVRYSYLVSAAPIEEADWGADRPVETRRRAATAAP